MDNDSTQQRSRDSMVDDLTKHLEDFVGSFCGGEGSDLSKQRNQWGHPFYLLFCCVVHILELPLQIQEVCTKCLLCTSICSIFILASTGCDKLQSKITYGILAVIVSGGVAACFCFFYHKRMFSSFKLRNEGKTKSDGKSAIIGIISRNLSSSSLPSTAKENFCNDHHISVV